MYKRSTVSASSLWSRTPSQGYIDRDEMHDWSGRHACTRPGVFRPILPGHLRAPAADPLISRTPSISHPSIFNSQPHPCYVHGIYIVRPCRGYITYMCGFRGNKEICYLLIIATLLFFFSSFKTRHLIFLDSQNHLNYIST